jgi:hypothetical protein
MIRRTCLAVVLTLASLGVVVRAAETLRITPVTHDKQVLVSFELDDAYSESVRDAIASGLRTTFTYELELRTVVPAWIDRTIATTSVSTSDRYDNLTRRHTLTRTVDGRVEKVLVTEDEAVVREWLTTWALVPLCDTAKLDATRDYYVRITTHARPFGDSLFAWTRGITSQARFSFVP